MLIYFRKWKYFVARTSDEKQNVSQRDEKWISSLITKTNTYYNENIYLFIY